MIIISEKNGVNDYVNEEEVGNDEDDAADDDDGNDHDDDDDGYLCQVWCEELFSLSSNLLSHNLNRDHSLLKG